MNPITKEEVILPRFELESDVKKFGISFKRRQFPVAPAFTITANKAQGQTIPGKVAIYLWDDCFLHGYLYLASLRATHPEHSRCFWNVHTPTKLESDSQLINHKMGFKVQVYIYDLTQGMARSLGPALLGKHLTFRLFVFDC